jgi:hypothetical protein
MEPIITQDVFEMVVRGIQEIWPDSSGITVEIESLPPAVRDLESSEDTEEREMVVANGFVRLYEGDEDGEITVEVLDFSKTEGHGALSLQEKSSFDNLPDAVAYAVSHMVRAQLQESLS